MDGKIEQDEEEEEEEEEEDSIEADDARKKGPRLTTHALRGS